MWSLQKEHAEGRELKERFTKSRRWIIVPRNYEF
jgi:hypothetical protein